MNNAAAARRVGPDRAREIERAMALLVKLSIAALDCGCLSVVAVGNDGWSVEFGSRRRGPPPRDPIGCARGRAMTALFPLFHGAIRRVRLSLSMSDNLRLLPKDVSA
jgi:hypothetical protein